MKNLALVAALVLLTAGFATTASAAGGSCNDAIDVLAGVTSGNMAGGGSQWFRFTATRSGDIPINTSLPGTLFDTTLAVYTSCGGAQIAHHEGAFPRKAYVTIPASSGQTYHIAVGSLSGGEGPFELGVDAAPLGVCPGVGDCFADNGTPGCDDTCGGPPCPGCCDTVCAVDPFCCTTTWDAFCEGEAVTLCTVIPVDLIGFDVQRD
jgi:hypothetical protein